MSSTKTTDRAATNGSRPSPVGRPVGTTARTAARNRSRIALGAFVLVASALAAGLMYANLGDRQPVLAVARAVEAGQVIESADLREVLAAPVPGVRTVPAANRQAMVGRSAAVRLMPGALLHPAQLASATTRESGQAIVGAVLKPGLYPLGLRVGDEVLAVVVPIEGTPSTDSDVGPPMTAEVTAIQPASNPGSGLSVSLGVEPGDASMLATAAARGRLTLVLAPR